MFTMLTCGFTRAVHSTFGIPVLVDKTIDEINALIYSVAMIVMAVKNYKING